MAVHVSHSTLDMRIHSETLCTFPNTMVLDWKNSHFRARGFHTATTLYFKCEKRTGTVLYALPTSTTTALILACSHSSSEKSSTTSPSQMPPALSCRIFLFFAPITAQCAMCDRSVIPFRKHLFATAVAVPRIVRSDGRGSSWRNEVWAFHSLASSIARHPPFWGTLNRGTYQTTPSHRSFSSGTGPLNQLLATSSRALS